MEKLIITVNPTIKGSKNHVFYTNNLKIGKIHGLNTRLVSRLRCFLESKKYINCDEAFNDTMKRMNETYTRKHADMVEKRNKRKKKIKLKILPYYNDL